MSDLFLFAVEDVIKIDGLAGHVLLPGISCGENMPDIAVGAPLAIVTPGRSRIETPLASYALIRMQPRREPLCLPITVHYPLAKDHIPQGSRVYLTGADQATVLDL